MIYNILCTIFSDIMTITQRQTDPVRDELYTAIAKVEKVLISEKGKIRYRKKVKLPPSVLQKFGRIYFLNYVKLIF
jgi:hypothetical protein